MLLPAPLGRSLPQVARRHGCCWACPLQQPDIGILHWPFISMQVVVMHRTAQSVCGSDACCFTPDSVLTPLLTGNSGVQLPWRGPL